MTKKPSAAVNEAHVSLELFAQTPCGVIMSLLRYCHLWRKPSAFAVSYNSSHRLLAKGRKFARTTCFVALFAIIQSLIAPTAWAEPKKTQAESPQLSKAFKAYSALEKAGKVKEALPFAKKALALSEAELGPTHKTTGILLYNLADLHRRLGQYRTAKPLFERGLQIWERKLGKSHKSITQFLVRLGLVARMSADYKSSEHYYKRYYALVRSFIPAEPQKVVAAQNNLAGLYRELGRYKEAEPLYRASITQLKAGLPKTRINLGIVQDNLAVLLRELGAYLEAEALHKKSLENIRKTLGPDSLDIGHVFNNLGSLYLEQGRYKSAEPMMVRAVEIFSQKYPPSHPRLGFAYDNLAGIKRHLRKYQEAEVFYKKALNIITTRLNANHPDVGVALNNLSMLYLDTRELKKALPLQERALSISRHSFGSEHPNVAFQLTNLGDLYAELKRNDKAEIHLTEGVEMTRRVLGAAHPLLAKRQALLGYLQLDMGKTTKAFENIHAATQILEKRALTSASMGVKGRNMLELRRHRTMFERLAAAAWQEAGVSGAKRGALSNIAFEAAQRARQTSANVALAQMATRFAAGEGALGSVIRESQDLAQKWSQTDKAMFRGLSLPPKKRNDQLITVLRQKLNDVEEKMGKIDAKLAKSFPQFVELSNPKPLSIHKTRDLLAPGEAIVQFLVSPRGALAWLITKDDEHWVRLDLSTQDLRTRVAELRDGLSNTNNSVRTNWGGLRFNLKKSHELYRVLFGKFGAALNNVKHLMFVPTGSLSSLPPAVLITAPPTRSRANYDTLRTAPWLIRKFAITVLPSVSALRSLRVFAKHGALGRKPFIGFGNPLLKGSNEAAQPARGGVSTQTQPKLAPQKLAPPKLAQLFRGAGADVNAVRKMWSLPDTADELKAIAVSLKVSFDNLFLGKNATESILKSMPLDRYQVVSFATHGLLAGELNGLVEPALVLTPPKKATRNDDGLLTASEVAALKLDADWVLLSACNTASGDGKSGAEGLSGLAKAFFYAGARSILVSHWPVLSHAAVDLTTGSFTAMRAAEAQNAPIGRAEAVRRSMLTFMSDTSNPQNAHPESWAPFVLVGEGALRPSATSQ